MLDIELQPKPRVAIETHGCKLNQADSGGLATEFAQAGFEVVGEAASVDVYVVNSCTVTPRGRLEGPPSAALRAATASERHHSSYRLLRAALAGDPAAARRGRSRRWQYRESDPRATRHRLDGDEIVPCATGDDVQAINPSAARTRAMVKIQEGCNQVCAYCIVPKVRGRERSIPPDEIVGTINQYTKRGYKEVVLTGTQTWLVRLRFGRDQPRGADPARVRSV